MKLKLVLLLLATVLLSLEAVRGSDQFSVIHVPKCTKFIDNAGKIDMDDVPGVTMATLGLPLNKDIEWNGLLEGCLFSRPKALVLFSVLNSNDGIFNLMKTAKHSFTLKHKGDDVDSDLVMNSINNMKWKDEPFTLDFFTHSMMLSTRTRYSEMFDSLPPTLHSFNFDSEFLSADKLLSLNSTQEPEILLLGELQAVSQIIDIISRPGNRAALSKLKSPDYLHFTLSGLPAIESTYGHFSQQLKDASSIVEDFLKQVSKRLRDIYKDNIVIEVLSFVPNSGEVLIRKGRSLLETESSSNTTTNLNLAPQYSEYYSQYFNIILWTSVTLSLSMFFIAWCIWNMDPGRDSVIYRMSSQRMKRD